MSNTSKRPGEKFVKDIERATPLEYHQLSEMDQSLTESFFGRGPQGQPVKGADISSVSIFSQDPLQETRNL
jgi:hypothetical protein